MFVIYKQKTAYEMRISDWSSDVCSSDLHKRDIKRDVDEKQPARQGVHARLVGGYGYHARCHDHAEISGRHIGQSIPAEMRDVLWCVREWLVVEIGGRPLLVFALGA